MKNRKNPSPEKLALVVDPKQTYFSFVATSQDATAPATAPVPPQARPITRPPAVPRAIPKPSRLSKTSRATAPKDPAGKLPVAAVPVVPAPAKQPPISSSAVQGVGAAAPAAMPKAAGNADADALRQKQKDLMARTRALHRKSGRRRTEAVLSRSQRARLEAYADAEKLDLGRALAQVVDRFLRP